MKEKSRDAAIKSSTNFGKRSHTRPIQGISFCCAAIPMAVTGQHSISCTCTAVMTINFAITNAGIAGYQRGWGYYSDV